MDMVPPMHATDLDVSGKQVGELSSPDGITRFFEALGYDTRRLTPLTPESVGLSGDSGISQRHISFMESGRARPSRCRLPARSPQPLPPTNDALKLS